MQPQRLERPLDISLPIDPDRRRLLKAGVAGTALALSGVALAQREGVQVGPRSHFESLVPAAEIEAQACLLYTSPSPRD